MINHRKPLTALLFFFIASLLTAEGARIHIIKEGETIYAIARSYAVSPDLILDFNKIKDPQKIKPGMKIEIPSVYLVQKGDSLYSVARETGVSFKELLKINGFTTTTTLKIGQKILLPLNPENTIQIANGKSDEKKPIPAPVKSPPQTGTIPEKTGPQPDFDKVSWPCVGDITYLNGKFGGVAISGRNGDSVRAVAGGNVIHAEIFRGWGKVVFIRSEDGYIYGYGGYGTVTVKVGDTIKAGTAIGTLAMDPREEKALLRFFVYKNGKIIDPTVAPRG